MIQVYSPWNQDYENNGNAVLNPEVCELEMNICGAWELTLENPLDENAGLIVENAVIKCDTPIGEGQMFRIYDREISIHSPYTGRDCIPYDSKIVSNK